MPEESGDSRGSTSPDIVAAVSDDVNALSLSVKRPSTYLGISSVLAVMRVIIWVDPDSAPYLSVPPNRPWRSKQNETFMPDGGTAWHPQQQMRPPTSLPAQQPPHLQTNSVQLVNAYFAYFHAFIPLLDESSVREAMATGKRSDPRWMALLNMVLALGSIAAYTADDTSHERYYQRSRQFLTLESLGGAHIETVQTLALMGGYYLHYASQPNLAHSLMGAALRMATTLGLHKEFMGSNIPTSDRNHKLSVDLRRRVWWSLFCLDTWAYMTLGRPSLGRSGPGITAKIPHYSSDRVGIIFFSLSFLFSSFSSFCLFIYKKCLVTDSDSSGHRTWRASSNREQPVLQNRNPSLRRTRRFATGQLSRHGEPRQPASRLV